MSNNLIDSSVHDLLEAFGAGNPTPGSGSAAALQGLLAAQLIRTVTKLTLRNNKYEGEHARLIEYENEIAEKIEPALKDLFEQDSALFEGVIEARKRRNGASSQKERQTWQGRELERLRRCTESPLAIARLCLRLTTFAKRLVDNGFKTARGDSNAALNAALAGVGGALSIVELNLAKFPDKEWAEDTRIEALEMRSHWETASDTARNRVAALGDEQVAKARKALATKVSDLSERAQSDAGHSSKAIEGTARELQYLLWKHRSRLWPDAIPTRKIDVLDPSVALRVLGYDVQYLAGLGRNEMPGNAFETAGMIDPQRGLVQISEQFLPPIQNFTTAHELGHALLHPQNSLHRDRELDGSTLPAGADPIERQANRFATYFLMPEGQVKEQFRLRFATEQFAINAATALHLRETSVNALREIAARRLGLAHHLASVTLYDASPFISLHEKFRVSVTAMAIRLEELRLVEP